MPHLNPLTDAFGTRLDPTKLLAELGSLGLGNARLVVRDHEVVLECPEPDIRRNDVARALTWLRTQFSPLVAARAAPLTAGPGFADERARAPAIVGIVEVFEPDQGFTEAVEQLLDRLDTREASAAELEMPPIDDALHGGLIERLGHAVQARACERASISVLLPPRKGPRVAGAVATGTSNATLHFLLWVRPGGAQGVRQAALVAASRELGALAWLGSALVSRARARGPQEPDILMDGLEWGVARRPTVAAKANDGMPIQVDAGRCVSCTVCEQVCPTGYLGSKGLPKREDPRDCILCYDCVEACPVDALRPSYNAASATRASVLDHRPEWLSRLSGAPGPSFPAAFPPSFLLPKREEAPAGAPRYVLGLAVMTMQEHAAVLLRDGILVGAIEHERLVRIRHAGWHPPERPGVTAAVDPTLCLEETFCRRPIRALLEQQGITLDDIDLIAVNGLHGRYRHAFSFIDSDLPIPTLRAGRVVFVPHHLCHAASAYRLSGARDAWVLTVDGRGDRECAAVFRAENGELSIEGTVLALTDRSIGGVYEGVTRLLGFGTHGQGSVMALASFGKPTYDMSAFLHITGCEEDIHETGLDECFESLRRDHAEPIGADHQNLAASLQAALESSMEQLVARHVDGAPVPALCLAGGVALNCRMNERLRRRFQPREIFVQPGANDAGTAIGAALEAWHGIHPGDIHPKLTHAYLGPEFDDEAIEAALRRAGARYRRVESITRETADRLSRGQVVCWFQGKMEFGPRALGARSILADPRNAGIHARVNRIKQREPWRPFGPSILAGHEGEWLEHAFDTRFMVFTLRVLEHQRGRIPAVVHVDGTTRPQVVHRQDSPVYFDLIEEFLRITGIPMVLNTSFNRRGEPIVCSPEDAVQSFFGLGADALAIGSFIAEPERVTTHIPAERELSACPGGRRLSLRLTASCDFDCGHCTAADLRRYPDRSREDAERALAAGRQAGCDELVILRGEAALRSDLPEIVTRARRMGYRFVQLQTNAHALASQERLRLLLAAGVDAFEVMLLAADESLHDELSGAPGSLRLTLLALRALAQTKRELLVTVPILAGNMRQLGAIVHLASKLGCKRIQFAFPRPVELDDRVVTAPVPRLSIAAHYVRQAARLAAELGVSVTTEAFPFCQLPEELRAASEASQDWSLHRIDDLHLLHESLAGVRRSQRPEPPACRLCSVSAVCPKTWALYLELFGSDELSPL